MAKAARASNQAHTRDFHFPTAAHDPAPMTADPFRYSPANGNLLRRQPIQPLAMTPPGTGVTTLEHQAAGRTDPDAVDAALANIGGR